MEQNSLFATPADRRAAMRHLMLTDHGFLRALWTHEYEIVPGVWRSNQPSPRRVAAWAARGITSVLHLRGTGRGTPVCDLEREACAAHGVRMHFAPMSGGMLSTRAQLLNLLDTFASLEKPFVMHCKSGIDRTGLAAFLYLASQTDTPPEVARRQLSLRFLHVKTKRHGILDVLADSYVAAHAASGVSVKDWISETYDPELLTKAYKSGLQAA